MDFDQFLRHNRQQGSFTRLDRLPIRESACCDIPERRAKRSSPNPALNICCHPMPMTTVSRLASLTLLVLPVGCKTSALTAQLADVDAPDLAAASYTVVGQVEGRGEAAQLFPFLARIFGADTVAETAALEAFGEAIYDRDDIDMIIAPKTKETGLRFPFFFEKVTVTVKGKGVKIIDGQRVQGAPAYTGQ